MDITKLTPTNEIQEHWLQFIHKKEIITDNWRVWFYVGDDDRFIIEMIIVHHDLTNKKDLMNLWVKHGFIKEPQKTHIHIQTYYTDIDGNTTGIYNPTLTKDNKIDFSKLLPYTPENAAELISEAIRMCEMDIR